MALSAVANLLDNLSDLEKYHADLIRGAEKEIQQLRSDLSLLKAFLEDVAEEGAGEIKTRIKKVVGEVEDKIESSLSSARTAPKISNKLTKLSRSFSTSKVSLAKEVKSLVETKVRELLDDAIGCSSSNASSTRRQIRPTTKPELAMRRNGGLECEKITFFEREKTSIIDYLMEERKKLEVISITGTVGLGKTRLASKIYEYERIISHFRTRIWVHLARKLKIRDVFLSILKSFTADDMSILSDEELTDTVATLLKEEEFLLVLDDLRSFQDWEAMKRILPANNGKSRILITSRQNHVSDGKDYSLRLLSQDDERWELLRLTVFGKSGDCPKELEEIGRSIAAKCGLPLQIDVVGRILSENLNEKEWRKVFENVDLFSNSEEGISNLVELSSNALPDDMRECFLYMGVFPEDCEISVWRLTSLWIAEGFVQATERESMEENAVRILNHLLSRKLVVADKLSIDGEVKTCHLHDVVRAFCVTKSMEQDLFREMKDSGVIEQNPHRLVSHCDPSRRLPGYPNGLQTRSFLCFNDQGFEVTPEQIIDHFPKLRILESNSIKYKQFPEKLTRLIHLRYLTMNIDSLKSLPESLSHLWNLQTLLVETKSTSVEMKANIWRMTQLRHVKTEAAVSLSGKGEGLAGEKLQTLDKLSPQSCTEDVFKSASNLKKLGIRGKLDTHSEHMFLEKLTRLEKLKVVNDIYDEIASENMLARVLEPKCLPAYLKKLTLSNTYLEWRHLSALATMKFLEVLKLKRNAFCGSRWRAPEDCFPNLRFLLISRADLVHWELASDKGFMRLESLVLKDCEKLDQIPEAVANTVEVFDIDGVSKALIDLASKLEEEKKKVQKPFKLSIGHEFYC